MYNPSFLIFLFPLTVQTGAGVSESQPGFKAASSLASRDRLLFHIALVTMSHSLQQAWERASVVAV